jgi:hypothetical protein
MARGGWVNTVHGDLQRIPDVDAYWMARAQKLFLSLQAQDRIHSFGAAPGTGRPYGFAAATHHGSVYVAINPSLAPAQLDLPALSTIRPIDGDGRIQFRDAGFKLRLHGNTITLGPGQMAMVGYGRYAQPAYNFGVQQDVVIPKLIERVDADFQSTAPGALEARMDPPIEGVLRIVVLGRAFVSQHPSNSAPGGLADPGSNRNFTFEVTQGGRPIPVRLNGEETSDGEAPRFRSIWLVAEIDVDDLTPGLPIRVRIQSQLGESADLQASAYQVIY